MKTRVLILPSWYPSPRTPVSGTFIHEQAVALARAYDVAVLTPDLITFRDVLRGNVRLRPAYAEVNGVRIFSEAGWMWLPRYPARRYHAYLGAAQRGFRRVIKKWGMPDLIHAHVVLPAGYVACQLAADVPVVLTEHSGPFSVHLTTEFQQRLVTQSLQRVDRVVAVSPALAATMQQLAPDVDIAIVGNLIATEFFTPVTEIPGDTPLRPSRFLTVAVLSEGKGIQFLLEAAASLVRQGCTDFELVIGGDGMIRPQLEHQAQALGLARRCRFLGSLTRTQVRSQMRDCDVFVLPSLHETFGVVLAEAMACGKPVIATRCGGPEFIVTSETGLLVEPGNPLALAQAMKRFVSDDLRFDPVRIRHSVLDRFGEQAFIHKLGAIYETVSRRETSPD